MARYTIREHVEANSVKITGAPDSLLARRERMLALMIDGVLLGDHEHGERYSKEAQKRLDEMLALAHALVGAEVDDEVVSIASQSTRHELATADFEAILCDGRHVKIELARLSDEAEKKYVNAIGRIASLAETKVSKRTSFQKLLGHDAVFVRFYGGAPSPHDIKAAATELANLICNEAPAVPASRRLWEAGERYPVLHRLGAHWARDSDSHPSRVMVEPMPHIVRPNLLSAFEREFRKKAKKVEQYSDGLPVWLAMYGDTRMTFPLGAVQSIAERTDFNCLPFERVIVGCFTAGVTFQDHLPPRYVSHSST